MSKKCKSFINGFLFFGHNFNFAALNREQNLFRVNGQQTGGDSMGLFDSLKRGSFIASFKTTKEMFETFLDDYLKLKAEVQILEGKKEFEEKFKIKQAELKSMEKTLKEVAEWCDEAKKKIEEVLK